MNSEITHQRGVGLIEVLIASLVLAVAVVGTSILLVDSVRSLSDASIRSDALLASTHCLEAGRLDPGSCNATQSIASIRTDLTRNYSVAAVTEGSELGVSLVWNDAFNDDSARSISAAVVVPDSARVIKPSLLVASLNIQSPGAGVPTPPSEVDDSGSDDESSPETDTDRVTNWTVSLSEYGDGSDGSDTVANGENAMVKIDVGSVPAGQVMIAATGCADATSVTVSGGDTIFVSDVAGNCTVTPVFEAIDTSWTGSVRVELTQYSSNKWFQILRPGICSMFGKNNGKKHNTNCSFTSDAASKSVTVTINIASQDFICTGKDTGAKGSWSTTLNISASNPNAKVILARRGGVGNCKGSDAAKITYSN